MQKIVFLGTSSAYPTNTRNVNSLAIVNHKNKICIVDCGEATINQILKYKKENPYFKLCNIESILITHLHADHFLGIFGLLISMSLSRTESVKIIGPKGIEHLLDTVLFNTRRSFKLDIRELDNFSGYVDEILECSLETVPLKHRIPTQGFILKEKDRVKFNPQKAKDLGIEYRDFGKIIRDGFIKVDENVVDISQVSDTIRGKSIGIMQDVNSLEMSTEYFENCSVLIHEATYDKSMEEFAKQRGHSTSAMAGKFAHKANVGYLILTHFSKRYGDVEFLGDEARETFQSDNVIVAKDFMTYTF